MYSPVPMKDSTRYGNNYWEAYSPKMKRDVRLFSDLEYDHWILVETNPRVKFFCEQPLRIETSIDRKSTESIFDMWIEWKDGQETFVEVKYAAELNPGHKNYERVRQQTAVQREWCRLNGKSYQIRTDRESRGNRLYLENMRTLLPYACQRKSPIDTDCRHILRILQEQSMSIQDIQERLPSIPVPRLRESIYRLIYDGVLVPINIEHTPLGKHTEVRCHG